MTTTTRPTHCRPVLLWKSSSIIVAVVAVTEIGRYRRPTENNPAASRTMVGAVWFGAILVRRRQCGVARARH
jgi:hypothetical protein